VERTTPGCPSDEEVARFIDGQLAGDELTAVRAHLDGCAGCRALVAGTVEPSELGKGTLVGRYVVVQHIGAGAMASVYSAYDTLLDRRVALKLLSSREGGSDAQELLLREAQVLASFSHPNVTTVFDTGTFGDQVFLAMELVDGGTLRQWLATPHTRAEILSVFVAAGQGLAAAHKTGIVHRDFKPENVLVGSDGRVRVTDFGLAGPTGGAGSHGGTPAYMAPEQMSGWPSDARVDIFSFSVSLYEALYGIRPFAGETMSALRAAIIDGKLREPPRRAPSWLHKLVLSGLASDPAQRPESMEALLTALAADPARRRRRWLATAALALVAAGAGVFAQRALSARAASCSGERALLDGAWDATRREAMRQSFVATGLPYAASTFTVASRELDAYAEKWGKLRTESCQATRLKHTQPEETLALRAACYDARRRELRALTDAFVAADRTIVDHAVTAVGALNPLDDCSDVRALGMPVPRPRDPVTRERLDAALAKVDEALAMVNLGKPSDKVRVMAQSALDEIRAIGHAPSMAYAALVLSDVEIHTGQFDHGLALSEAALYDGQRGRDDRQVIQASLGLTMQLGVYSGRPDDALRWSRLGFATIERLGNRPHDIIALKSARSLVYMNLGKLDEAFADKREVVDAWAKEYGANSIHVLEARSNLGIILTAQGRFEEARAEFAAVVPGLEELGTDNPEVLPARMNLGSSLLMLGRLDEAAPILEAVTEQTHRLNGETSLYYGTALINLGELRIARGQFAEALDLERKAIAIFERRSPRHPGLCEPLTQVGVALSALGRPAEAVAPLERALDIAKSAAQPADRARAEFVLARALATRDPARSKSLATSAQKFWLDAAKRWGGENHRFAAEITQFLAAK
jgi:serine/threonine-protein kinase